MELLLLAIRGRHNIYSIFMTHSLLALSPEDVLPAMYLCTNKIAPDHENMVSLLALFNKSSSLVMEGVDLSLSLLIFVLS